MGEPSRREARLGILALDPDIVRETLDELVQSETDGEMLVYVAEIIVASDSKDGAIRILPLLDNEESHLRRHICGLLSNCRDLRTMQPLIAILQSDSSADVRVLAAFALGKIRDSRALPALRLVQSQDFETDFEGTSVSQEAMSAIHAIEPE